MRTTRDGDRPEHRQGVLVERPEFDRPGRRASDKLSLFYSIPPKYWAHGSALSIMSGHESRYNRPSSNSNEERKHFLNGNDGLVPLEDHIPTQAIPASDRRAMGCNGHFGLHPHLHHDSHALAEHEELLDPQRDPLYFAPILPHKVKSGTNSD